MILSKMYIDAERLRKFVIINVCFTSLSDFLTAKQRIQLFHCITEITSRNICIGILLSTGALSEYMNQIKNNSHPSSVDENILVELTISCFNETVMDRRRSHLRIWANKLHSSIRFTWTLRYRRFSFTYIEHKNRAVYKKNE